MLFQLFRPAPELRDHFAVLVGALNKPDKIAAVGGALRALLVQFWPLALLALLAAVLIGVAVVRSVGPGYGYVAAAAWALAIVAAWLVCLGLAMWLRRDWRAAMTLTRTVLFWMVTSIAATAVLLWIATARDRRVARRRHRSACGRAAAVPRTRGGAVRRAFRNHAARRSASQSLGTLQRSRRQGRRPSAAADRLAHRLLQRTCRHGTARPAAYVRRPVGRADGADRRRGTQHAGPRAAARSAGDDHRGQSAHVLCDSAARSAGQFLYDPAEWGRSSRRRSCSGWTRSPRSGTPAVNRSPAQTARRCDGCRAVATCPWSSRCG